MSQTSEQILSAAFATRNAIAVGVEKQIAASHHAIATFRSRAGQSSTEARASLQNAIVAARQQETALRVSLRDLRVATEDGFEAAPSKLANDFNAYATAVAQVEASGSASTGGK